MIRHRGYYTAIRNTLTAALCIQDFASQRVERHNKPQIEDQSNAELVLNPVVISYSPTMRVLIETSINSVRVSALVSKNDSMDAFIVKKMIRFMCQRAEDFIILRRKPIQGYDISFLIVNSHLENYLKHKLVDFIIQFLENINSEAMEMKVNLNIRAKEVSQAFYQAFFDTR